MTNILEKLTEKGHFRIYAQLTKSEANRLDKLYKQLGDEKKIRLAAKRQRRKPLSKSK